LASICQEWF